MKTWHLKDKKTEKKRKSTKIKDFFLEKVFKPSPKILFRIPGFD